METAQQFFYSLATAIAVDRFYPHIKPFDSVARIETLQQFHQTLSMERVYLSTSAA